MNTSVFGIDYYAFCCRSCYSVFDIKSDNFFKINSFLESGLTAGYIIHSLTCSRFLSQFVRIGCYNTTSGNVVVMTRYMFTLFSYIYLRYIPRGASASRSATTSRRINASLSSPASDPSAYKRSVTTSLEAEETSIASVIVPYTEAAVSGSSKTGRISPINRIVHHINIKIYPPFKPNGISRNVSSGIGIIITVPIVVQSGFRIVILPRKSEIIRYIWPDKPMLFRTADKNPPIRPDRIRLQFSAVFRDGH